MEFRNAAGIKKNRMTPLPDSQQEAQLMLTNTRDTFRGQYRSPNMVPVPFDMLGMVSY